MAIGVEMKVLIISSEFPPGPGGIGNHAYNLSRSLHNTGIPVSVLTVSDNATTVEERAFDAGLHIKITRFERYSNKLKTISRRLGLIRRHVRDKGLTHVILTGRFPLLTAGYIRFFAPKLKIVTVAHGTDVKSNNPVLQKAINLSLRRADLVIPVSNFTKSKISADIQPEKVKIIPNGCEIGKWSKSNTNGSVANNGQLNLVTVGSVTPRKGQHNVINKLTELQKKYSNPFYHIVGLVIDKTKVDSLPNAGEVKDNYKFYGRISDAEISRVLSDAHIFTMLSEETPDGNAEGFGIAILEANSIGLPAIGAKGSGVEDAIKDGYSGKLIDKDDTEAFVAAVEDIMINYETYRRNAEKWAEKHRWENIVKSYLEALNSIN